MSDLTEQWKNGKLPEGWYYIKCDDEICFDRFTYFGGFSHFFNYSVQQILASVPSYEKWKALNGNMDSVMQTNQALCKKLAELKEVLIDCVKMNTQLENALWQWNEESELYDENEALENKIDEVLNA